MNQPKNIKKIQKNFYKSDLYESVAKRKRKLVKLLQATPQMVLPLTKISKEDDLEDLIECLQKVQDPDHAVYMVNGESPRITLLKKRENSDFLWIEYFRLYHISTDRSSIRRYSYVECYFDEYVLSCIMDISQLEKDRAFAPLNMDKKEWGFARQQIKYWNKYLFPQNEELQIDTVKYPKELKKRIEYYTQWESDNLQERYNCPAAGDPLWSVLSYLYIFQMLLWVPKKNIPMYYINFVCSTTTDRDTFAKRLCFFLSEYFSDDPVICGDVKLVQKLLEESEDDESENAARPYVFVPEKTKDLDRLRSLMNNTTAADKQRRSHPFRNRIPICVSEQHVLDSTALNIIVSDIAAIEWDCTLYDCLKESCSFIYGYPSTFAGKTEIRDALKIRSYKARLQIIADGLSCGFSFDTMKSIWKYEKNYLRLVAWFRMLWNNVADDDLTKEQATMIGSIIGAAAQKLHSLDEVIEGLMIHFKKEFDQLPDARPLYTGRNTKAEQIFKSTVEGKTNFTGLFYHAEAFASYLKLVAPHVEMTSVLKRMKEKGLLKTKNEKDLIYGINLMREMPGKTDRKTVNYYVFIIE